MSRQSPPNPQNPTYPGSADLVIIGPRECRCRNPTCIQPRMTTRFRVAVRVVRQSSQGSPAIECRICGPGPHCAEPNPCIGCLAIATHRVVIPSETRDLLFPPSDRADPPSSLALLEGGASLRSG